MDFHSPSLSDKEWIQNAINIRQTECCDYCFGNIFMWSDIYDNRVLNYDGLFISADFKEKPVFCYPVGSGDKVGLINELIDHTKGDLEFHGLTEKDVNELENLFPQKFIINEERDFFDYVYRTEDLANLSGRKYHSKRNHIAFFEKTYNWKFEPITKDNIIKCILLNDHWVRLNEHKNPEEIIEENIGINKVLNNYFDLGLEGGMITIEGEAIAFTFGEKLNNNTFCTHVEKAYGDIRGAYPIINRELAKYLLPKYEYINREDDTGSEGLRTAKLSYHPHHLVVKYSAVYKG